MRRMWTTGVLCFPLMADSAHAEVKLPALFGSHMVLQQNMPLHIWGMAATRYMLLDLFHASAQAAQEGTPFLPESVLRIRDTADARKLSAARKLLQEFRAGQKESESGGGAGK